MSTTYPANTEKNESSQDAGSFIDMLDPANILSWSYRLVVTPIELKQAVAKVGSSAARVRAYFGLSDFEVWPFAAQSTSTSSVI